MDPNSWESHRLHVTESLERLEAQNQAQSDKIGEIHREIVGFKADQKWQMKLFGIAWGFIVTGINYFLGR